MYEDVWRLVERIYFWNSASTEAELKNVIFCDKKSATHCQPWHGVCERGMYAPSGIAVMLSRINCRTCIVESSY